MDNSFFERAVVTTSFTTRVTRAPRLPFVPFGLAMSLFLAITYVLCVGFDLIFPSQAMYQNWTHLLPGFTWLSWESFFVGLIDSLAYGWFVALVFVPLFNVFSVKFQE